MKLAHLHPWGGRKRRGLSLQEMLIVVAVFAILAIVFMFSSKELMIRTKISRAHSDLQSLITAIDTRADGNGDLRDYTVRVGHANRFTILPRNMTDVKSIPEDVFSSVTGEKLRLYFIESDEGAPPIVVAVSAGPDGAFDLDFGFDEDELKEGAIVDSVASSRPDLPPVKIEPRVLRDWIDSRRYDPSNGIDSAGDIIRTSSGN